MRLLDRKANGQPASVAGLSSENLFAINVAKWLAFDWDIEFVLTSVTDGAHSSPRSKHYVQNGGHAFDLRFWSIPASRREEFCAELRSRLGCQLVSGQWKGDYQVVLETTHIHVEFDP